MGEFEMDEGIVDIEYNSMQLEVHWLWECEDEEGHASTYSVQEAFVYDDQGNKYGIILSDKAEAEIAARVTEIEEKNLAMDREP
jgi:hypothetical protein